MPDPNPNPTDRPEKIADAASLFDTDEVRPYRAPVTPPRPRISEPEPARAAPISDGYELEGTPFAAEDDEPPRPVPLPTPVARPKSRPKPTVEREESGDSNEFEAEAATVDPIWSRGAEWGPDLIRIAMAGVATLVLAWFASSISLVMALLVMAVGGAAVVLLSYPVLITLERPVRITPEQAVKDFFAAASHHVPHYRRMWLLLSSAGRESGPFSDFESFRGHWKSKIHGWKSGVGAGKFAPLTFEVGEYTADKSTGKSTSKADYSVRVFVRDQEGGSPIVAFRMVHGLVKGPDRMWYLNRGSLDPAKR